MKEDKSTPQINSAKLGIGSGVAGAIFTIGSLVIFLLGVPVLRYVFPVAILLGVVVAFGLHFVRRQTPGTPWLLSATEKETPASDQKHSQEPKKQLRGILLDSPTAC